ncbi:MAG TPA: acetamidase/formamidase family protein [Rubrobacter sp.]|jgi:acetamidase/formamidase
MATRGDRDHATGGGGRSFHAVRPDAFNYVWDNSIEPELEVDSGEVVEDHGLSREEAYALCSVAVDLRIHEVVDAPNWVVGAFLPDDIFTGGGDR